MRILKFNRILQITIAIALVILFTGCADVTVIDACTTTEPYGFWGGLWHGMIAPFSFFGSLFSDDIAVYAVNNNGRWYDFGFVLGIGALTSSGTVRR